MSENDGKSKADERVKQVPFQQDRIRQGILLSYWVVILLALPLWWTTTSISRLSLPEHQVKVEAAKQLTFSPKILLDSSLRDEVAKSLGGVLQSWSLVDVFKPEFPTQKHSEEDYSVSLRGDSQWKLLEGRDMAFGTKDLASSQINAQLTFLLSELIAGNFAQRSESTTVVQYSPRYRLSFSLLNEDASSEGYASDWDIEEMVAKSLKPVLDRLSVLHNFTIESQVQFYAPLAFTPEQVPGSEGVYGLTPEQLTVFVNSAEWTLSSGVTIDPVLHFVLFVPSASRRPLRILDHNGAISDSNAFVLPQWGSIYIYNPPAHVSTSSYQLSADDLRPAFAIFRSQLLKLLGVPSLPTGVSVKSTGPGTTHISDWQLDALLRKRAYENARGSAEALSSIVNLVNQIEGMPVSKAVRDDVGESLSSLNSLFADASQSPRLALQYSSKALAFASRAFFNPDMLALLYFPPEHKVAVYTPLLAPIGVVLVVAVIREVSVLRKRQRR